MDQLSSTKFTGGGRTTVPISLVQSSSNLLSKHQNPMFKCPICSYESCHKSSLRTHMKTHSAERPWKCDICSKTFKLKHHLKHHLITHRVGGSFKCTLCPYRGASTYSLMLHKQSRHGEAIPQVNMQRMLNTNSKKASSYSRASLNATWATPTSLSDQIQFTTQVQSPAVSQSTSFATSSMTDISQRIRSLSESEGLPKITNISSSSDLLSPPITDSPLSAFRMDVSEMDSIRNTLGSTNSDALVIKMESERQNGSFIDLVEDDSEQNDDELRSPSKTPTGIETPASEGCIAASSTSRYVMPSGASISDGILSTSQETTRTTKPDILANHTHVATTANSESWKCEPCGIIFTDNIMYGLHTACHSVVQPYKCNICGRVCRDKYDFTFHITMGKHE